jgi:hypothetical protein
MPNLNSNLNESLRGEFYWENEGKEFQASWEKQKGIAKVYVKYLERKIESGRAPIFMVNLNIGFKYLIMQLFNI